MSNNLIVEKLKTLLNQIKVNENGDNFVNLGVIPEVFVRENTIDVVIEFDQKIELKQQNIEQALKDYQDIRLIFTAKKQEKPVRTKQNINNVKRIILFASAKGGVGKSTTAVNSAIALAKLGYKVGVIDADIYGPTLPKLLGISEKPETAEGKMLPIYKHGIYSISIGYIVDEDRAAIWRGPMVSKALYQLLLGVKWPELDYLIIDMPPGTGDIYLSLADNFVIDGAVLVTTPQNIALSILKKSLSFFDKTNIPVIGIIENMSYFWDEENNLKHYIFGPSSIKEKLLGEVPLIPKISQFSDQGKNLIEEKEMGIYEKIVSNILTIVVS